MNTINSAVKKLFGYNMEKHDINSKEFMLQSFKNTDSTCSKYYEQTADRAIKDFLFEHSDIAIELKKLMEKLDDSPEEENT